LGIAGVKYLYKSDTIPISNEQCQSTEGTVKGDGKWSHIYWVSAINEQAHYGYGKLQ